MFLAGAWNSLVQTAWPHGRSVGAEPMQTVAEIREHAGRLRHLSDAALREQVVGLRGQTAPRTREPRVRLPAAFALLTEAARRVLGIELFDVQLLAGIALARPAIAEMQTGEGKTLSAALPAALHAMSGCSVHVVTPNAYLAGRDCELVRPVFELLGISIGLLGEGGDRAGKIAAYQCDVTYGTGYEFGFDYLRDQLQLLAAPPRRLGDRVRGQLAGLESAPIRPVQRELAVAIIDEIDSVLIDEACLPLVLSGLASTRGSSDAPIAAGQLAAELTQDVDYHVDLRQRQVHLTDCGRDRVYDRAGSLGRFVLERPWEKYVEQALHARLMLRRDVDYMVRDGRVLLVDTFTGRVFGDRTWRDGLHQAVEAKESLAPSPERPPAARISRQRYFGMYRTICGMTGTARDSHREFRSLYRLPVASIPLRNRSARQLLATRYFSQAAAKWQAALAEIAQMHALGRPVLVGSKTIENSRLVAQLLTQAGIEHRLLNGAQDEDEARIIASAGQARAVTVATNMAGRGTDIKLATGVAALGGLHLVAVERHESRRIDRQLVGRVARQGDPGSCRFLVSAEDALIRRFAPELGAEMAQIVGTQGIESSRFDRLVEAAQMRSEAQSRHDRRRMLAYDTWLDEILAQLGKVQ